MRVGGSDAFQDRQLFGDKAAHFAHMTPLDNHAQIAAAGNKPHAVDFGVAVKPLGDGVKADFAGGENFDVNERKDFFDPGFLPVYNRLVMLDNPPALVIGNRRPDFRNAAPGQRRNRLRLRAGIAGENRENFVRRRLRVRLCACVRLVHHG